MMMMMIDNEGDNERWESIMNKNDDGSSEDNEQVMLDYGRLRLMIGHDEDEGNNWRCRMMDG